MIHLHEMKNRQLPVAYLWLARSNPSCGYTIEDGEMWIVKGGISGRTKCFQHPPRSLDDPYYQTIRRSQGIETVDPNVIPPNLKIIS